MKPARWSRVKAVVVVAEAAAAAEVAVDIVAAAVVVAEAANAADATAAIVAAETAADATKLFTPNKRSGPFTGAAFFVPALNHGISKLSKLTEFMGKVYQIYPVQLVAGAGSRAGRPVPRDRRARVTANFS